MMLRSALLLFLAGAAAFAQDAPRVAVVVIGGGFVKDLFDSRYSDRGDNRFNVSAFPNGDARVKRYLVGPSVEVRVPWRLSVEFDALYTRLNGEFYNYTSTAAGVVPSIAAVATANRWEFPLLAKYNIPTGTHLHPFVGAGPSFSLLAQQDYRSTSAASANSLNLRRDARDFGTGVTVAGGLSLDFRHVRFTPQIRYTRRDRNNSFILPTSADGVQALVGISFGR